MPARLRWLLTRAGAAAVLMAAASQVHAHTAAKEVGDFYAGFLHPLTALEHVLSFVAFGLLIGQQGHKASAAVLVFSLMLMLGAAVALWVPAIPYVGLANIFSAVLLGGLIAAAWPLPVLVTQGLAVVFGLSHGLANGSAITSAIRPYLFIPGIGLAGLVVAAWGIILTDFVLRQKAGWMRIALRVAGSWIAAIGILVLATSASTLSRA